MCVLVVPPTNGNSHAIHDGGGWLATTLSRMTLSGQGAARLMTIDTSVAAKMIARVRRYGRSKSRSSGGTAGVSWFADNVQPNRSSGCHRRRGCFDVVQNLGQYSVAQRNRDGGPYGPQRGIPARELLRGAVRAPPHGRVVRWRSHSSLLSTGATSSWRRCGGSSRPGRSAPHVCWRSPSC